MATATKSKKKVSRDITTGIGTLSFPHVFTSTASKKDDGSASYDIQIIIPKSQREDVRALLAAIREVGEAEFGENWKKVKIPLRDGDKEKNDITDDGSTKGDKYPERLGCVFLNARSTKPVGVYARDRSPITSPDELYGGCKGKIAISFYSYSKQGNTGIGVSLNGVQKISDGEPFGSSRPTVETMFDMLDDADDLGLEDEVEEVEEAPKPPAKKAAAKKAPAKKAAAKKAEPEPEPEPDEDDDLDLLDGDEEDNEFLDDLED